MSFDPVSRILDYINLRYGKGEDYAFFFAVNCVSKFYFSGFLLVVVCGMVVGMRLPDVPRSSK